jgi:hypothetical protein
MSSPTTTPSLRTSPQPAAISQQPNHGSTQPRVNRASFSIRDAPGIQIAWRDYVAFFNAVEFFKGHTAAR